MNHEHSLQPALAPRGPLVKGLLHALWARLTGQRATGKRVTKPSPARPDKRGAKPAAAGETRRVWRMSDDSPSGGWVDTAPEPLVQSETPKPPKPPTEPRDPTSSGWLMSSMDLLTGIDVVEGADQPPGAPGSANEKPPARPAAGSKAAPAHPPKDKPHG